MTPKVTMFSFLHSQTLTGLNFYCCATLVRVSVWKTSPVLLEICAQAGEQVVFQEALELDRRNHRLGTQLMVMQKKCAQGLGTSFSAKFVILKAAAK